MAVVRALFGLFLVTVVTGQIVDITPREAVRRIGDDLNVLCKVAYPIDSCRVTVGQVSYRLLPSNQDGDVVYAGQGLQFGECGAHIKHIKEEWNGNISCVLPPQAGNIEVLGTMRLLVARAPGDPILQTSPFGTFVEGEILKARCAVPNGRPAARVTWFLDQEPLLQGVHQPIITTEPGTDLQTVSQNVTRTLTADDSGRKLICRAEHEALDQPKEVWQQLAVHYGPKRLESGPITIFGLKLGSEGRLNVTVRAHPPPEVEWTVGDARLRPGQANEDRSIMALEPIALESGYYNITLVLARITKQDVERTYYVTVKNQVGEEQMTVRISTMMEPAGVELDTGAIVGIVIGVLIVLIAVFLAVFAKATDRWCFAGHGRDHTKNSGESSDTESAVGGRDGRAARSRLADLGARMRAVLPRAKDKVATETQADNEDKPLSDEKKSVVYAELALGDQTSTEKPPPPSTEYAEIVYSDQTQQKEVKEDHK